MTKEFPKVYADQENKYYMIQLAEDDSFLTVQRRHVVNTSDSSLSQWEKVIIAFCDKAIEKENP